jgi:hypothetical protein
LTIPESVPGDDTYSHKLDSGQGGLSESRGQKHRFSEHASSQSLIARLELS